jgi:hypothetical protein
MRGRTSIGRRHALVKPYACRFTHLGRAYLCLLGRLSRRAHTCQGDRTKVTLRWPAVACGQCCCAMLGLQDMDDGAARFSERSSLPQLRFCLTSYR